MPSNNTIKKYDKYKDSGIPWIGEIPEEWNITKLKQHYQFEKGKNASLYTNEYIGANEGEYPVYSGQTENDGIMGLVNTFDYDEKICVFTTTVGAKVMSPKILSGKFCLSQNCLIMKRVGPLYEKFLYYQLFPLFDYEKSLIPSYMQPSLRISDLKKYFVLFCKEQQAIADYLDEKCGAIDKAIDTEKDIIEKLKEYKQSLITETVTKGLDKSAPMKDSGIPWIGQIPQHWEIRRLKEVVNRRNQKGLAQNQTYLALEHVSSYTGTYSIQENITPEGTPCMMKKGDILFAKLRPYLAKAIISDIEGVCSSEFLVLKDYKGVSFFLLRVLLSHWFINVVNSSTYGTKMPRANWGFIGNMEIPFPPKAEQQAIADYLDEKCSKIDKAIADKEQVIEKLTEYKKSLIYECVTGKRMVGNV